MRFPLLALLAVSVAVSSPARGQMRDADVVTIQGPFSLCVLHDTDEVYEGPPHLRTPLPERDAQKQAAFQVTYTGFSPEAHRGAGAADEVGLAHLAGGRGRGIDLLDGVVGHGKGEEREREG